MRLIQADEKLQAVAVAAVDVVTSGLGRRVVEVEVDRPQIAVVAEVQAALHVRVQGLGPNSIENFGLSFGLKNHSRFCLTFHTLRKCSQMGSLDMSQNQNGISICFSSQNFSY